MEDGYYLLLISFIDLRENKNKPIITYMVIKFIFITKVLQPHKKFITFFVFL